MAKVHPHGLLSSTPSYFTTKQETFTIWMKSLVLNGKGCTVFDSDGQVMYRVDNYNSNGGDGDEVFLMDSKGIVLFTIRKKFKLFKFWEGHRSSSSSDREIVDPKKPGFQVRRNFVNILRWNKECEVILGLENDQPYNYIIKSWNTSKCACKIVDKFGELIGEVKRKETRSGVVLGDDVLTMVVKPSIDHSLIMGLVVMYSLIKCKM